MNKLDNEISKGLLKGFLGMALAVAIVLTGGWSFGAKASDRPKLDAVQIYKQYSNSIFYMRVIREDGTLKTVGSGFLIGGGKALTAFHVVDGGKSYEAVFDDGVIIKDIKTAKTDKDNDLALVTINAGKREGLEVSSTGAEHGQKVFALGYPMKGTKIITEGITNTPKAEINGQSRILTSAQVASGMSGGPLLDRYGSVVGLISGSLRNMSNIHICVSADSIKSFIKED
ncbi:serine protease [Clostridium sp. BNL1100]|uniref:S1 family peptidase n=1 Tax=Clostridium sp. BNL1100 TaxID=755731 RepID=UPI00024A7BFB|nr:serine protease [Clostridium sp. BNL1100]AEY67482.1 trypsin-like serine protease with C-terminal PDZ domain [Clostridium sp. BNL1100]